MSHPPTNHATRKRRLLPAALTAALAIAVSGAVGAPLVANAAPDYVDDPAAYVNPFIGTTAGGNVFPGAVAPFGMLSFSPTQHRYTGVTSGEYLNKGALQSTNPSGYVYTNNTVRGFSLTHISGPGCAGASGDVPIFPMPNAPTAAPTLAEGTNPVYSTYTKANEEASAGYYRVGLANGVNAELSATERTGSARFEFPDEAEGSVLVRAAESLVGSTDANVKIDPATRTVSGSVTSGAFCGGYVGDGEVRRSYYTLHYVIEFDQPFKAVGTWTNTTLQPNSRQASGGNTISYAEGVTGASGSTASGFGTAGQGAGGYLVFDTSSTAKRKVNLRVGISYVSEANARLNLAAENPVGQTFEQTKAAAHDAWNDALNGIQVAGGTDDEREAFYTALYHAMIHPSLSDDVNGQYMGFEGDYRPFTLAPGQRHQYHTFSNWDIYRGQTQLLTWLDPKLGSDMAYSLLNQAQQNRFNAQGLRPQPGDADQGKDEWDRWTHVQGATHVMNGDPSAQIVAGIYTFGGTDFPVETAYQSLADAARNPTARDFSRRGWNIGPIGQRPSLDQLLKYGYYPEGCNAWGCLAETLEIAIADHGLAVLADALNKPTEAEEFAARANFWENNWDSNQVDTTVGYKGWIRPRNADGSWATGTITSSTSVVEGSIAQYVWLVQQNLGGLVEAMGGRDVAERRLDSFFHNVATGAWSLKNNSNSFNANLDNEPNIQTPFIYNWTNNPSKAQQTVREVMRRLWIEPLVGAVGTNGIPGNDDLGVMSAWYAFASIGLYPVDPAESWMTWATPIFTNVKVTRVGGGSLTINAPGASMENMYIASMKVDGVDTDLRYLPASKTAIGVDTTVDLTLSTTPTTWGAGEANEPPSARVGEKAYTTTAAPSTLPLVAGATSNLVTLRAQRVFPTRTAPLTYHVEPQYGITAVPPSGRLNFGTDAVATTGMRFIVPTSLEPGTYPVYINSTSGGVAQRPVRVDVVVNDPSVGFAFTGTGLEAGDAGLLADQNLANSGWIGFAAGSPEPTVVSAAGTVAAGTTHTGTRALQYAGQATANGATASFQVLDISGYSAAPGMKLSYWIRPSENRLLANGLVNDASGQAVLDVRFTDGTTLSSLGVSGDSGEALQRNAWQQITITFPTSVAGKTLDKLLLKLGPTPVYLGSSGAISSVMTPAPTPTASQNFAANESVTNLINSGTGKWLASQMQGPWWAVYEFATPQTVAKYVMVSANDADDRDPKGWLVQGSNDNATWTDLDSRSDQMFPTRRVEFDYTIPAANRAAYKYYRLLVTDRRGGSSADGGMMQIQSWLLYTQSATPSTANGYAQGLIDDITLTRPVNHAVIQSSNPELVAGTPFSGTLGTITNTYAPSTARISGTIDWGDGTSQTTATLTQTADGYSVAGSHSYLEPGSYAATLTINDDGITQVLPINVTVATPPDFYQPTVALPWDGMVEPGGSLSGVASGFKPTETVTLTINALPPFSVTEVANADGDVIFDLAIPEGTPPGTYSLTLIGQESGAQFVTPFEVVEVSEPTQSATPTTKPSNTPSAAPTRPQVRPNTSPAARITPAVTLSANQVKAPYGVQVKLTARVSDAAATGWISFLDGTKAVGRVKASGGTAVVTLKKLTVGKHSITAKYEGDAGRTAATSAVRTVKVVKAKPTSVKLTASATPTSAKARIKVGKLTNGRKAVGKVRVYVDGKVFKTVKLKATGKVSVKLPTSAWKIKAKFIPKNRTTTAVKSSKSAVLPQF